MRKLILALPTLLLIAGGSVAQEPAPCTILSKAEIQEAVGRPPADGKLDPRNSRVCHFSLGEPNTVTVGLEPVTTANNAERAIAEFKKRRSRIEMVAGLGDTAFFVDAFGMTTISVYKGQKVLSVVVFMMGTPAPKVKAIAEKLARKGVARM